MMTLSFVAHIFVVRVSEWGSERLEEERKQERADSNLSLVRSLRCREKNNLILESAEMWVKT